MKRNIGVFVGLVMLGTCLVGHAATRYVDSNGSGTSPYGSWGTAAKTINAALIGSAEGDTILVNDGIYVLVQPIAYTNRTVISVNGAEKTIISNPLSFGILLAGSNAVMRGFSITGGQTNDTGTAVAGGATMDACHVYGNTVQAVKVGAGGVYLELGNLINSKIYSNSVASKPSAKMDKLAGGVILLGGMMSNCQVYACRTLNADTNVELNVGGALAYQSFVYDSAIENNNASGQAITTVGGLFYLYSMTLQRTTVRENSAYSGYPGTKKVRVAGGIAGIADPARLKPEFDGCTIVSNFAEIASTADGYAVGGVMAQQDSNLFTNRVINSTISHNEAQVSLSGTALAVGGMYGDSCRLTNVLISANKGTTGGGSAIGGFFSEAGSELTRVKINNNNALAQNGFTVGGVTLEDGKVQYSYICGNSATCLAAAVGGYSMDNTTMRSILISGNTASAPGGESTGGGGGINNTRMESCTVAGNSATDGAGIIGGAVFQQSEAWNSIFYANEGKKAGYPSDVLAVGDGENVYEVVSGQTLFNSCCFPTVNAVLNGTGTMNVDPKFVRAAVGNYRLLADSPCRDNGVTQVWMSAATDVVGLPRVFGGMLERGAYEFIAVNNDFDGDGKSDVGCYYDTGANWYIDKSTDGFWTGELGAPNTDPVTGDFDGDGLCDYGVYDPPSGAWAIQRSSQGPWTTSFGYEGTVPVTGDFDGDSTYDFGCYYAPRGDWYIYQSTKGFWHNNFGYSGTVPVTGDFDGDGKCDFGCYYAPSGAWYIYKSSEGFWVNNFGYSGTVPITGDFDGDGRCDFGCYYAPGGNWYIYKSSEGFWMNNFGYEGTMAITGDYDGDGKADFGCYYPTGGNWYIYKSTDGFWTSTFGYAGTVPIGR